MSTRRLEAFSDGVIAIIITIMVLELKAPHGNQPADLRPLLPAFFSYILSFVYIGIYWNNHHHLLHACTLATGAMLWTNLHLLFWLSLLPFATGWMGENHFTAFPTALYGLILFMAAISYYFLQQASVRAQGQKSTLRSAIGRDWKGKLSPVLYCIAIASSLRYPRLAHVVYVFAALTWLIPDRRIENRLGMSADASRWDGDDARGSLDMAGHMENRLSADWNGVTCRVEAGNTNAANGSGDRVSGGMKKNDAMSCDDLKR